MKDLTVSNIDRQNILNNYVVLTQLQDYIGSSGTCSQSVGLQLKGNTVVQKAEILWNEWNGITGECTLTPQYPIRPTEAYKMISELQCIKPSIIKHKAQLVEVNKKQIYSQLTIVMYGRFSAAYCFWFQ